jgi:2-polyprenyl-3-methyl-5-hydroxy-6-metoxy-1,4-benzoquinol methylase
VTTAPRCPVCESTALEPFFAYDELPALCNALWADRDDARAAPRGCVRLAVCTECGMITNTSFDPAVFGYSPQYENSLHFSPAFQRFATGVARRLVDQHDLHDVDVVEIGPGAGDFLQMLCRLGDNRGTGYDPSHEPARAPDLDPRVTIVEREFPTDVIGAGVAASAETATAAGQVPTGHLVCARHVLEHVPDPAGLLTAMARSLDPDGVAYLEVPDGWYLVDRVAVWDVIYEHCHHFTAPALRRLAGRAGLRLVDTGTAFGDQFLWADAVRGTSSPSPTDRERVDAIVTQALRFGERAVALQARAADLVDDAAADGPVVVWGAGSKGVTFLTTVASAARVRGAVDINAHKRGRYVPVSGHPVVAPDDLVDDPPATAIVLNPVYVGEVRQQLVELGLSTRVATVEPVVPGAADTSVNPPSGRWT